LHNSSFSFIQHHLHLSEVASTNDLAKQLAEDNLVQQGYVITTDFQTNGRGQESSGWEAERGKNILCSVILNSNLPVDQQVYLNLSVSLAVYDFVKECCPNDDVRIKWPNDIYINNKKVAGILIENTIQGMSIKQSIVGIGINVNQEVFGLTKAISLSLVTGIHYDLNSCIKDLLQFLEERYSQLLEGNAGEPWQQYHEVLYRRNMLTDFKAHNEEFEGVPTGIDEAGRLLVSINEETKVFNVKEIVWC
jgi:BirA family biotin operon repressor/biotin-[acetyl-CoA-carboxylase] ligase